MVAYIDKLSEFGKSFQIKVIYSLIHDVKFLQDIFDIVESTYFEREEHQCNHRPDKRPHHHKSRFKHSTYAPLDKGGDVNNTQDFSINRINMIFC